MLNHERRGNGEPLVLIHGIGSRWQVWEPVLDALAEHFDVIALDLPGFGASPHAGGEIDVHSLVDAVEEFCSELGIERPHVAGNSMGGGIAIELGKRGFARSVTAFSPIGFWRAPGILWGRGVLRSLRAISRNARPALRSLLTTRAGRTVALGLLFGRPGRVNPEAALADADALAASAAFDQALASFRGYRSAAGGELDAIPVTIAWGTRDRLLTCAIQSKRARAVLPDARHTALAGCGHIPFPDNPRACVDVLLHRLEGR